MTSRAAQPKGSRREQRIIERPRLIKQLDETDARTILLLAPAGYGKTTLARQWAKTLSGAVWVTLTAAHRDVAVMATDIARAADPAELKVHSFISAYVRAHPPQRRAHETARAVCEQLEPRSIQWLVIDDYQEVVGNVEAELFVEAINASLPCRFLIASRLRPSWATARLVVYGDVLELDRSELALSAGESTQILGRHPDAAYVVAQAEGWPAVIGLASTAPIVRTPGEQLTSTLLHSYFAEELFQRAQEALQQQLMQLALAPDMTTETLGELFGEAAGSVLDDATDLGFVNTAPSGHELHPLVRDFLLRKLSGELDAREMVARAIRACLARRNWERAFDLILRFERVDLLEEALKAAYMPLMSSGRVATLAAFATRVRAAPLHSPPVIDLAEAEVALADGAFELASRVAKRVISQLQEPHVLLCRANSIVAESAYARAQVSDAELAYKDAHRTATTDADRVNALRGWALSSLQGESPAEEWVMRELEERRFASSIDLLRYSILELTRSHFTDGFAAADALLCETKAVLERVDDPRARSSFTHVAAYVTALRGRYKEALQWQRSCDKDISAFDLDFALPHSYWNHAYLSLGMRRFGAAERMLQRLEDSLVRHPLDYHALNARILRARLALETGRPADALSALPGPKRELVIPSLLGEYLATRALALAILDRRDEATCDADAALATTSAVEVRLLCAAASLIADRKTTAPNELRALWEMAEGWDVWDPIVVATRSSADLALALADHEQIREPLAALYQRTYDHGLARRSGLRTRSPGDPADLLSPRELEVLGLLGRGYRNKDIAEALVVSLSTVKVHVRHIFEKLGVRSRSEAVTRLATLE